MFWENLVRLLVAFTRLNIRRQAAALAVMLSILTALWWTLFYIRKAQYENDIRYEYSQQQRRAKLCGYDATTQTMFRKECDYAFQYTAETLSDKAFDETWRRSYLCGSVSCFDSVFGADSSMMGVTLRFSVIVLILSTCYFLVVAIKGALVGTDRMLKDGMRKYFESENRMILLPSAMSRFAEMRKATPVASAKLPAGPESD